MFRNNINYNFKKSTTLEKRGSGFTVVELVVVVAIFTFISALVLINFSGFNNRILVNNLAYDIALSIRKAQTFGLNVREVGTGTGQFSAGYGVFFNNNNTRYIFFADLNKNKVYNSTNSELLESFTIRGGNTILKICGLSSNETETCNDTGSISNLHITFTRPNPEAVIKSTSPAFDWAGARIYIVSQKGVERSITVRSTGQISIEGVF